MSESTPYADLRVTYNRETLDVTDVAGDPLTQFESWFSEAVAAEIPEPNAMVLATADASGQPSARNVLLKEADDRGFVFYTNYESRKGRELTENPRASIVFPWFGMFRQVVVVGSVQRVSRAETAEYFKQRPHESRIGAMVSAQSNVLESREELETRWAELSAKYPEGTEVPLPDFWGGFVVIPQTVEFWAGRRSRLHDRIEFVHDGSPQLSMRNPDQWSVRRLSP
ncbi:MAG: Pyridoxamine 5-phosphate oxidase [Actinomycetota bacterium]